MENIFLDYNSTTPVDKDVLNEMLRYLKNNYGNPSSIHQIGQQAKKGIETARERIANFINTEPHNIIFTSGGTESINTVIKGCFFNNISLTKKNRIIISTIEHKASIESCNYLKKKFNADIQYLLVSKEGIVETGKLKNYLNKDTILVSILYVNNETGMIQPIKKINNIIKEYNINNKTNIYFHTDAVQAAGKIKIDVKELAPDFLSLSSHKFYGPKGVGILYVKEGIKIDSFIHGGEQEKRRRAGTENTSAIVGMGKGAELAGKILINENKRLKKLKNKLWSGIKRIYPAAKLNGTFDNSISNTLNVSFPKKAGETIMLQFDMKGIAVSTGSACTVGSLKPSQTLRAMGLPESEVKSAIRFSLGKYTSENEIDTTLKILESMFSKIF